MEVMASTAIVQKNVKVRTYQSQPWARTNSHSCNTTALQGHTPVMRGPKYQSCLLYSVQHRETCFVTKGWLWMTLTSKPWLIVVLTFYGLNYISNNPTGCRSRQILDEVNYGWTRGGGWSFA